MIKNELILTLEQFLQFDEIIFNKLSIQSKINYTIRF